MSALRPGDLCVPWSTMTNTGRAVSLGLCELLEKRGTVPNYWTVRRQDPQVRGQVMTTFVYPEDLVATAPRPQLHVVK